jgi:hypothetical protein
MKELQWSNSNRPAKRYLYFRFIMTYLMCKAKGQSVDWVNEIAARGKMWCTPGPYLRRSMVQLLARECGDHFLPEVFYKKQTFNEQGLGEQNERSIARDMRDRMLLSSVKMDDSDNDSEDEREDTEDEGADSEDE